MNVLHINKGRDELALEVGDEYALFTLSLIRALAAECDESIYQFFDKGFPPGDETVGRLALDPTLEGEGWELLERESESTDFVMQAEPAIGFGNS